MPRRTSHHQTAERPVEARRSEDADTQTSVICSIDEVIARYPGQWIVMRVTEYDERHLPARGVLIAHARSRRAAARIWGDEIPRTKPGEGVLSLFDAYPRITTGEEARRSLAELRDQGDPPGRWPGLR
jgi:hypothetical protein